MKSFFILAISVCLILSCSKNSVEQEQDLCKDATTIPKISFIKLSNTFSNRVNLFGDRVKQDSIAITFRYQDTEADIGTFTAQKILNADGSREAFFADILKKNADGTFTKLILKEPFNSSLYPVPTQRNQVIGGSNLPFSITSLSSCSGEITYSISFEFGVLNYIGLKLNDKIKFQIYIKDRALHTSNIIETTETTISENP